MSGLGPVRLGSLAPAAGLMQQQQPPPRLLDAVEDAAPPQELMAHVPTPLSASPMSVVRAAREERSKKSLAHRHTEFYRLIAGDDGREYERRMCRYCDGVFSFRCGTTSAALRHLTKAHPERLIEAAAWTNVKNEQAIAAAAAAAMRDNGNDDDGNFNAGHAATVVIGDDGVASEASQDQSQAPRDDQDASLHQPSPGRAAASSSRTAQPLKRKRHRSDDDKNDDPKNQSDLQQRRHAAATAPSGPPPLTASQLAITHFLEHHKELLPVRCRLRFVKHLTHNPHEAEMYNVLDEATRIEYLKEFGPDSTANDALL